MGEVRNLFPAPLVVRRATSDDLARMIEHMWGLVVERLSAKALENDARVLAELTAPRSLDKRDRNAIVLTVDVAPGHSDDLAACDADEVRSAIELVFGPVVVKWTVANA